jgi:hypothetical protein
LPVTVGAAAAMAKSFGALVKVIFYFAASDGACTLNISYVSFLALEIFLCCVIAVIDIDNEHNAPYFRFLSFFLGIVEMCWLAVKGVMDIMDANGLFHCI